MERVMAGNEGLSANPTEFHTFARTDEDHAKFEQKRAAVDSWHDNSYSENLPIIKELYAPAGIPRTWDEDQFVTQVLRSPATPPSYFLHRRERLEEQVNGFLTPQLECLVNDRPFIPFADATSTNIVFPYDQGPALFKYFRGARNCLFFSDAVDTAPKKTKPDSQPYWAPFIGDLGNGHTGFTVRGVDLGFNEGVVRTIAFADFKADKSWAGKVGCKVLIEVGDSQGIFRWYDLANPDTRGRPSVLGNALNEAKFKLSNKPSGFFIGNEEGSAVLQDNTRSPIVHLCTVVAKILGDISVGIASSAQMKQYYKNLNWIALYNPSSTLDPKPTRFIHNTGDRTSSMEASRLGADALYTSPMREGSSPFRFIPGERTVVRTEVPDTFITRMNALRDEILTRYANLLQDLNVDDVDVGKYKVDGEPISIDNLPMLEAYIRDLRKRIEESSERTLGKIEALIQQTADAIQVEGDNSQKISIARKAYETLNNRKLLIMPHSPTISHPRIDGSRKSVISKFVVNQEERFIVNLRDGIYTIKTGRIMRRRLNEAGTRRGKRNRRRTYRMKGGKYEYPATKYEYPATFNSKQKDNLKKFEGIVNRIVEGAIRLQSGEEIKSSEKTTLLGNFFPTDTLDQVKGFLESVKTCTFKDGPAYDEMLMKLLEDDLEERIDAIQYKKESIEIYKQIVEYDPKERSKSVDSTGSRASEASKASEASLLSQAAPASVGKESVETKGSEPGSIGTDPASTLPTNLAGEFESQARSVIGGRKTRRRRMIF